MLSPTPEARILLRRDPIEASPDFAARQLLRRTGVVFRKTIERERMPVPWWRLVRELRTLDARGRLARSRSASTARIVCCARVARGHLHGHAASTLPDGAQESRRRARRTVRRRIRRRTVRPVAQLGRAGASTYRTAEPFPHLVEDGLFDPSILERVVDEFETMDRGGWHHSEATHEPKLSTEDARQLGPFTSALIAQLNAGPFISFLEELTGIGGLVPDPHLRGGGLHEIRQGGLLGVHADFNVHPRLKLYRRLNLLIYLNTDWQESWGGALELWDRSGQQCVRAIQPVFNRAVHFDTSNFSYHGHPHPLACPFERSRKSVVLYILLARVPGRGRSRRAWHDLSRDHARERNSTDRAPERRRCKR